MDAISGGIVSSGWDDTIRHGDGVTATGAAGLGGQPKCSGSSGDLVVVATGTDLVCFEGDGVKGTTPIEFCATAIAVSKGSDMVVVADDKNKIHVFSASGGALTKVSEVLGHTGIVYSLAFSPNGESLAAGDVKEVRVWNVADWSAEIKGKWQFHTSRITGVAWSADGKYIASCSGDEQVFIWWPEKKLRRLNYKFAHKGGCAGIDWIGEGKLVTSGNDGSVCEWDVSADMAEKFK